MSTSPAVIRNQDSGSYGFLVGTDTCRVVAVGCEASNEVRAWSTLDSTRAVEDGLSPSPPRRIGAARLSGTTSEWVVIQQVASVRSSRSTSRQGRTNP